MTTTVIGRIRLVGLLCSLNFAVSMYAIMPSYTMPTSIVDSLLNVYDTEIESAYSYIDERRNYIDSLKSTIDMTLPKSQITIGKLYIPYQCDSALFYLSQATHATEEIRAKESTLYLIYLLASIGYYNEGFILSNTLQPLPPELLSQYYETLAHLHGEAFVYGKTERLKQYHQHQASMSVLHYLL